MIQYCPFCFRQYTGDICDACGLGPAEQQSEMVRLSECSAEAETWHLMANVFRIERDAARRERDAYLADDGALTLSVEYSRRLEAKLGSARIALAKARERFLALSSFEPRLSYVVTDTADRGIAELDEAIAIIGDSDP